MKNSIILLYGWGPEEETRAETLFYIAKTSKMIDIDTHIFLFIDGVLLAKKGVARMISEKVDNALKEALKLGTKIYACEAAVKSKGLKKEDLVEGVSIIGYASFLDLALKADAVITL